MKKDFKLADLYNMAERPKAINVPRGVGPTPEKYTLPQRALGALLTGGENLADRAYHKLSDYIVPPEPLPEPDDMSPEAIARDKVRMEYYRLHPEEEIL